MNYAELASEEKLQNTVAALTAKKYQVHSVADKTQALAKIKELIPAGASIMNGASVTLEQIGFVDLLKSGDHSWNNLHQSIVTEQDELKKAELRKQAVLSDWYLGSVHALCETGEFIVASNTGSQLPHVVYTSPNLLFVVSTKKIVPNLAHAMNRLEEYVVPLEDKHMQDLYNMGTALNKIVVFRNESTLVQRTIHFILVEEDLGF